MEHIEWNDSNKLICKFKNMFGVYIANDLELADNDIKDFITAELMKLYTDEDQFREVHIATIFGGLLLFDTKSEARDYYNIFTQELTDSSNIYACIYSNTGEPLSENT